MDWMILLPALAAILGSLVTGCFMYLNQRLAQREERARQIRELAAHCVIAKWQKHFDWIVNDRSERPELGHEFPEIGLYLIHLLPVFEAVLSESLSSNIDTEAFITRIMKADQIGKKSADRLESLMTRRNVAE